MTTNSTDTCGTVRASLFYRAPIFSESGACVLAKNHEGDHRDAKGARWYVIPLVGQVNAGAEGHALTHAHDTTWTPEPPFRSPRCVLGQHPQCRDAEPRETGVPGVHYLVCTCVCHHPTAPPTTRTCA